MTLEQFHAAQISAEAFTHEAHVHMGWLCVQAYGSQATERFDASLRQLVKTLGAESKYDARVTWLFMQLIAARFDPDESWPEFRARNRDLVEDLPRPTH